MPRGVPNKAKCKVRKRHREKLINAEQQLKMLQLRNEGMTVREIGDELQMSKATVHRAIVAYLKEISEMSREEAMFLRAEQNEKLNKYEREMNFILYSRDARWQKATNIKGEVIMLDVDGEEQRMKAVDRLLKIQERRAALFGLDSAKKIDEANPNELPPVQIAVNVQMAMPILQSVIAGRVTAGTVLEA